MITFTRRTVTHTEATDDVSIAESTITGSAFEKSTGEGDAFKALSLTRADGRLLLFTPTSYDIAAEVLPGDTCVWPEVGGETFTARWSRHVRPDGQGPILSYVIVSK